MKTIKELKDHKCFLDEVALEDCTGCAYKDALEDVLELIDEISYDANCGTDDKELSVKELKTRINVKCNSVANCEKGEQDG